MLYRMRKCIQMVLDAVTLNIILGTGAICFNRMFYNLKLLVTAEKTGGSFKSGLPTRRSDITFSVLEVDISK